MNEGYLIVNCKNENLTQVEFLIKSIRFFDPERPISIITGEKNLRGSLPYVDKVINIDIDENITKVYFESLLKSPYEKTIAFLPDQILTDFNPNVWENLRGMNSIVMPKTKQNFNGEKLDATAYYQGTIEEKTFGQSSILNAVFFNKSKGCDYIFGTAVLISAHYEQAKFIDFVVENELDSLPSFPDYMWPEWLLTFLHKILGFKITKFDFINCIDLSKRENSYINDNWSKRPWTEFLSYWVNELGSIKIENYVQSGLVKYSTSAWLTESTLTNLRKKFI